jgi:diguanylate cyclase (GGDEF)-like protein
MLQTYLIEHDSLAWIGGEFTIILPTYSAKDAIKYFKQIRAAIEDLKISYLEEVICFTVSIGGATDLSAETVLKRADALYQAKQAGRPEYQL